MEINQGVFVRFQRFKRKNAYGCKQRLVVIATFHSIRNNNNNNNNNYNNDNNNNNYNSNNNNNNNNDNTDNDNNWIVIKRRELQHPSVIGPVEFRSLLAFWRKCCQVG